MAKTHPDQMPELIGDAAMVPYFHQLPSVKSDSKKIPAIMAVYFVYTEPDIILYVGQAFNLRERWKGHRFPRTILNEVKPLRLYWLPVDAWTINVIEQYYIRKLRPPLNKNHARASRSVIGPQWFIEDRIAKLATYNA